MTDLDSILSIVENPTRRRILEALVREPHYPLQLSHELGVSQQAIMKNLALMEKEGLLESYRESSKIGPDRNFYRPTSEFNIVIDMRGNMFEMKMTSSAPRQETEPEKEPDKDNENEEVHLDDTRARIASIDRQISEFEKQIQQLREERSNLIQTFMRSASGSMDYDHRELLYDMLNRPNWGTDDISRYIGMNQLMISQMIDEVMSVLNEDNVKEKKEE